MFLSQFYSDNFIKCLVWSFDCALYLHLYIVGTLRDLLLNPVLLLGKCAHPSFICKVRYEESICAALLLRWRVLYGGHLTLFCALSTAHTYHRKAKKHAQESICFLLKAYSCSGSPGPAPGGDPALWCLRYHYCYRSWLNIIF